MAALNPEMIFHRGDMVEVASLQRGFRGSYYEATVAYETLVNDIVEYETLVNDDFSGPLRELVTAAEVRPRPPVVRMSGEFRVRDVVDAFDNDGCWVGRITGKVGVKFMMCFESSIEEIGYTVDRQRVHLEWNHSRATWTS